MWNLGSGVANVLRPPRPFEDSSLEEAFLGAYRRSAIRLSTIAFTVAALMAFAFWLLLLFFPTDAQTSAARQVLRLVVAVGLLAAAANLHLRPERAVRSFRLSVGMPMALGCLIVSSLGLVPLDSGDLAVNRFVVGTTLACWLCYGFTRLPVSIVAAACIPASFLTVASVKLQGDDHALALAVYLIVANFIGWILAVEIERRERALFWSARQLAAARAGAEAMAREVAEADAAKTRVLAAVSHDLRQPLASLTLYAQHLREQEEGARGDAVRQTVDRLEACIGAISSDLDRLSELGLRERGERLPVRTIDLRPVLDRIERVYSGLASRAGIRLVVRVPEPGEYCVVSNESRLWDVFANLVGNALKFPAPGRPGWVLVRVRQRRGALEVVVRDNGIGIDAPDHRRVFDEYFQVANPSRSGKQGQGLGLSIVRETVSRLSNHSIRLRSRVGEGTMFALRLPGSRQRRPEAASRSRSGRGASFLYPLAGEARAVPVGPCHVTDVCTPRDRGSHGSSGAGACHSDESRAEEACVLVVEDDEAMCDALSRTFERWGFLVRCAQNGEEAIALGTDLQRSLDAIVCDFRLPGAWDGLRLIDELRRLEGRRTPAILLSGEFRVETLRCDAPADVHVMAKPPDVGRLRALLAEARSRSLIEAG